MNRVPSASPVLARRGVIRFLPRTQGLTLIEMLIVIAILAILSASIGTLIDQTLLGQKELQIRNDLHSECAGVFTAVTREAAVANECLIAGEAGATSGTLLALRGPAATTTDAAQAPAPRWVVYRLQDGRVTRTVFAEGENPDHDILTADMLSRPASPRFPQTLATHVNGFTVAADDTGLLRVRIQAGAAVGRRPIRVEGATAVALPRSAKIDRISLPEAAPR